jgi:hypothetical protein
LLKTDDFARQLDLLYLFPKMKALRLLLLVAHLAHASSEAPHIDPTYDDKLGKQGTAALG